MLLPQRDIYLGNRSRLKIFINYQAFNCLKLCRFPRYFSTLPAAEAVPHPASTRETLHAQSFCLFAELPKRPGSGAFRGTAPTCSSALRRPGRPRVIKETLADGRRRHRVGWKRRTGRVLYRRRGGAGRVGRGARCAAPVVVRFPVTP